MWPTVPHSPPPFTVHTRLHVLSVSFTISQIKLSCHFPNVSDFGRRKEVGRVDKVHFCPVISGLRLTLVLP